MSSKHKKLIVDGKVMRVFLVNDNQELPESIKKLEHLHGIKMEDANPQEFLDDYEKRYGALPDIGGN